MDGYLHVSSLVLNNMNLSGKLPEELAGLTYVDEISLASNNIGGTLTDSIGLLRHLLVLNFTDNTFSGSIPQTIEDAQELHVVDLSLNFLTGNLPMAMGNLANLTALILFDNELSGAIPKSFQNLDNLTTLWLSSNGFTGTLPNFLAQLPLREILLEKNNFTGTIPTELASLPSLKALRLINNQINGSIPVGFGGLPQLYELTLGNNSLTGTVPSDMLSSQSLQLLILDFNHLIGTIPAVSKKGLPLLYCSMHNNELTGTIPPSLGMLANVTVLQLAFNKLTSTIPVQVGNLSNMISLNLAGNKLSGTLPESLENLKKLQYLYLNRNQFRGTIPEYIGQMSSLEFIAVQRNMFSGLLPVAFSQLTQLQYLFAYGNRLKGTLEGVFDPSTQTMLSELQLDSNGFSGQIPSELFKFPLLSTIVLDSNCFDGTLPQSACEAWNLQTLSASGLRSAHACRSTIFGRLADTYRLKHGIDGGVPACYFSLPRLTSLHLSGNGLTGTLPSDTQVGTYLADVVLSHNRLTGSIPVYFQQRQWYNLDLSYNRIRGTLRSDFGTIPLNASVVSSVEFANGTAVNAPTGTLTLRNNRLSSAVPSVLHNMENISILEGNLFDCRLNERDLPVHDSARDTYSCGSNTFNLSYGIYLLILGLVLCVALALYINRSAVKEYVDIVTVISTVQQWISFSNWYRRYSADGEPHMIYYSYLLQLFDEICGVASYCTLYTVVVLTPMYLVLSHYYRTHNTEYAWLASAAYLSGTPALVTMIVFVSLLMALFLYWFTVLTTRAQERLTSHVRRISSLRFSGSLSSGAGATWRDFAIYFAYAAANIVVVSLVNVAYVLAEINAPPLFKTLAQLALSMFRLLWNLFGTQYILRASLRHLSTDQSSWHAANNSTFFAVQLFVALFNAIAVPCAVIAVIGPDCFNSAFVPAADVTAYIRYPVCILPTAKRGCLLYATSDRYTTFAPPFVYSYECSGSLVTFYAPTFVYTGLMVTFFNPLLNQLQRWVYVRTPRCSRWYWIVNKLVPRVVRPVNADTVAYDAPYRYWKPYFDANFLLLTTVTYLGVVMTFGVVFPPVAVVMLIAMISTIYTSRANVGRFLSEAVAQNIHHYADVIEKECVEMNCVQKLTYCARVLAIIAGIFYPFFLFDILGDKSGAANAFWVFIVTPLVPILIFLTLDAVMTDRGATRRDNVVSLTRKGLELGVIGSSSMGGACRADDESGEATQNRSGDSGEDSMVLNVLHGPGQVGP